VDIAVVVNLKARKGSHRIARACREHLPDARILASDSMDATVDFAKALHERPPRLLVSGGGDGTVVALINAMRDLSIGEGQKTPWLATSPHAPTLGLLALGTGNGWARATGAPAWRSAFERLGSLNHRGGPLPVRRFDLVEAFGTVAHFAGTGWDAEIIDDFHAQKDGFGILPKRSRKGLAGYLHGLVTRTIPRHLMDPPPEVEIYNTGADAIGVDDQGRPMPLPGGKHGALLYRGPVSVCGAGTTPEWGFGFRAFPFAGLVPRRFCLRVYAGRALEATLRMKQLWSGAHPLTKMHTWLLTRCRAVFSRAVPFQIGGDRVGYKTEVEYKLAEEQVDVLDWGRIAA
jgi:hypothetical protein